MVRGVLAKQIIADANTSRSGVYRWLRENYTEVAKAIPVRGSWDALRRAAIEAEVTTRKGPPTVAALRSAWLRVVADMERAGGHGARNPAPRQAKAQPIDRPVTTPKDAAPKDANPDPDVHDHPLPPKFTFRPTKLR